MADNTLLTILVPGKDDRAFYKKFFILVGKKLNVKVIDLDSNNYLQKKRSILDKICKQHRRAQAKGEFLRGTSAVKLLSKDRKKEINIVIVPAERKVTQLASIILEYQAGLSNPSIDFIVVADDAEEKDFDQKLESLYNSIKSLSNIEIDKELSSGKYYRLLVLKKPRGVKLMLIVQGIKLVTIVTKHAIGDYILYLYRDLVDEMIKTTNKFMQIVNIKTDKHKHKKLALLIAVKLCYTKIEEIFLKNLNMDHLNELIRTCDALNTLISIIANTLNA